MRQLEIGAKGRIPGFETLDIVPGQDIDHVADCRKLPFKSGTFDLVYASHVIEHIQWNEVEATIAEWARVLVPGGHLEIHTVDAYRLMKALITLEETGEWTGPDPTWLREMTRGEPYLYTSGRLLNRPKGGNVYQLHRSLITPKYLRQCFERAGLTDFEPLTPADARGTRHSEWINLGLRGTKC